MIGSVRDSLWSLDVCLYNSGVLGHDNGAIPNEEPREDDSVDRKYSIEICSSRAVESRHFNFNNEKDESSGDDIFYESDEGMSVEGGYLRCRIMIRRMIQIVGIFQDIKKTKECGPT